jgi:hypothetical protein
MEMQELKEFLTNISTPEIKPNPKTFLGIAKQPHYENVMSNIYAFFFQKDHEHKLGDIFIKAIMSLVNEMPKNEKKSFDTTIPCRVDTEKQTRKNGRIDLLITNNIEAILIENKVFHHLNNDLDDYFESVVHQGYEADNITAIVLTRYNIDSLTHLKYINITHAQLLKRVMEFSQEIPLNKDNKFHTFLLDLNQNVNNLSKPKMTKEQVEFYNIHSIEINKATSFGNEFKKHVVSEVKKAAGQILTTKLLRMGEGNSEVNRLRYFTSTKFENLRIVPLFEDLLNGKSKMCIIIEIRNKLKDRFNEFKNLDFTPEEKSIINESPDFSNTKWVHFSIRDYNLTSGEIENLSKFILRKLKEDSLLSVFNKIDTYLRQEK